MKLISTGLLALLLLTGCAFNQHQSDLAGNDYHATPVHADAKAVYVGIWTAGTKVGIRSVKIREDGRFKVCLAPSAGTVEGKVYLDNGRPALMINNGARARIISMDREVLLLDLYGQEEKYYAGLVPDECLSAFTNF